jgi:hypothetical protein
MQSMDVVSRWRLASANFQAMSPEEQGKILVSAGILTKKGNVTKRYKGVIVPIAAKTSSKAE